MMQRSTSPLAEANRHAGPTAHYDTKLNRAQLPQTILASRQIDADYRVEIYQIQAYQKEDPELLNAVFIRKTHLKTGKVGQVLLFSTDIAA